MNQSENLIDTTLDYYYTEGHVSDSISYFDLHNIHTSTSTTMDFLINLIANHKIGEMRNILENDCLCRKYIDICDDDSDTLLHFSVFADSYDLTNLFLEYGIDPNKTDTDGQTPLFRIIFAADNNIIDLLLRYGAHIDHQDNKGNTVLHNAVLSKNYKIIQSLLCHGADPSVRNNDGLLPLDYAIRKIDKIFILDDDIVSIFKNS